jgi:large subunit ribosomal protein L15
MKLNEIHQGIQKNKRARRVGRGTGSGLGKTAGRGHKGQKSRAGWSKHPAFQGGTMPLVRRVPKRGFNNRWALTIATVNVGDLERAFESGDEVNPETLRAKSLAKQKYDELKILGDGSLTKKLTVSAHRFSASAREKIEQAGGQAIVVAPKTPVSQKQKNSKEDQG